MAETHDLRLKVDAGAAERGARQFVSALNAMRAAVKGLERDSTGSFKKLQQSLKMVEDARKVKMPGADKSALNSLEKYARMQREALKATAATRKEANALKKTISDLATGYDHAAATIDKMNKALLQSNAHLKRQIQLASQARSAVRQIRSAPTETSASPATARGGSARTSRAQAGQQAKVNAELERSEALQNRITRAIDNQRSATASLMSSLAKVGATGEIARLESAFDKFRSTLSATDASYKTLDDAQTKLNHVQKTARVALTRLNAELAHQREDLKAAADAAKAQAAAFRELTKAANAAQRARTSEARETARQAQLQTSATKSMQQAEITAARLTERLRNIGDTRGINAVSTALQKMRRDMAAGVNTQQDLRNVQTAFSGTITTTNKALIAQEAAHRRAALAARQQADQQRRVHSQAMEIEREMRSLAGATNATSAAWHRATGNMRGLENAFNMTYQAGSLFRNMLGALTLGTFVRSVYDAGNSLQQFMVTMEVATGSAAGAVENAMFVDQLASKFGTSLRTAREDYAKFAVAAELAGVAGEQTQDIFESVSMAMSVMGRGAEDQRLAFLALEQMMSKGTVSSEELRRQLGERLPGAVNLMAKALNVTTGELQDLLKAGAISSADALPKFAEEVRKAFGPGLESSMSRASTNIGKFMNEIERFLSRVAASGFTDTLAVEFAKLTKMMQSENVGKLADELGMQLSRAAEVASRAMQWMVENVDDVRKAFTAIGVGILANKLAHLGSFFIASAQQAAAAVAQFRGTKTVTDMTAASTDMYSAALARNTTAVGTNALAQRGLSTALTSVEAQQKLRMAMLGHEVTQNLDLVNSQKKVTGALGKTTAALAGMSRMLTVAAPWIGILVTAAMLLPDVMGAFSDSVVDADEEVQRAIKRSGVAFEELGDTIKSVTSNVALDTIITDIDALTNGLSKLNTANSSRGMTIQMMGVEMRQGRVGDEGFMDRMSRKAMDMLGGTDLSTTTKMMDGMSAAAQDMAIEFTDDITRVEQGMASASEVFEDIKAAMNEAPSGRTYFQYMAEHLQAYVMQEKALLAQRKKLVTMRGSQSDKDLMGLGEMGADFIKGNEGAYDNAQKRADELRETYAKMPEVLSQIDRIMEQLDTSVFEGDSDITYIKAIEDAWNTVPNAIQRATDKVRDTEQAYDVASKAADAYVKETKKKLTDLSGALPKGSVAGFDGIFKAYNDAPDVALDPKKMRDVADSLAGLNQAMPLFTAEALDQFDALRAADQTYQNLDVIIEQLSRKYPALAGAAQTWQESLSAMAAEQNSGALSLTDLQHQMSAFADTLKNTEAHDAAMQMIELVDALFAAELAGDKANAGLDAAKKGAEGYEKTVDRLVRAQDDLNTRLGEHMDDIKKAADDIRLDTDLMKMPEWMRDGEEMLREGLKDIEEWRKEQMAQDGTGMTQYRSINSMADQKIAELRAEIEKLQDAAKIEFDTKAVEDLRKEITDFGKEVTQTSVALQLLLNGQVRTREEADMLAEAMATGNAELVKHAQETINAARSQSMLNERMEEWVDLRDEVKDFTKELFEEYAAVSLLASGQVKSADHAEMMAKALASGNAQLIESTQNAIRYAGSLQPLIDNMNEVASISEDIKDAEKDMFSDNLALQLQIEGQAKTAEGAEMLARAMITGDAAAIQQARAFDVNAAAAERLNKELTKMAEDPLKEWQEALPSWVEIGKELEVGVFESLSDEISNFIQTGEFSIESFADSVLGTISDMVADLATQEIMDLFKIGDGFGDGWDQMFKDIDGDPQQTQTVASMLEGGQQAGIVMTNAVAEGGRVAALALRDAMSALNFSGGMGQNEALATFGGPTNAAAAAMGDGKVEKAMATAAAKGFGDAFAQAERKYGLPTGYLSRTAQIESSFNPNAKNPNSSAGGLFQFINSTASQYGLSNKYDPMQAIDAAARLAADNTKALKGVLGRNPTGGELYLAHQQGAGGASKLLGNPNAAATSLVGSNAVTLNGGNAGMTGQGFANIWLDKFGSDPMASTGGAGAGAGVAEAITQAGQQVGTTLNQQLVQAGQQAATTMGTQVTQGGTSAGSQMSSQMQTGGMQAGVQVGSQMSVGGMTAGMQVGSQMQTAGTAAGGAINGQINAGGTTAAAAMNTAIVSGGSVAAAQMGAAAAAGGGGGGIPGGIPGAESAGGFDWTTMAITMGLSLLPSLFGGGGGDSSSKNENEYSIVLPDEDPDARVVSYAQGTANTSGIPATLHQNEAVIPLSGSRKVPVELTDGAGRGGNTITQNITVVTPNADSFRKSEKQLAAAAAGAGRRAMRDNG